MDDRGYSVVHQRVVLDVDLSGILTGSAHLTINPTSPLLRTIYLHASPLLRIQSVTLSSPTAVNPLLQTPASFALTNPSQSTSRLTDIKSHPEFKRKTWAASNERDEGELAISVSGGWVRITGEDLAPIEVQIDYQLLPCITEGIVFKEDHVYLSPTAHNAARIWTPCVDDLWARCTWELEMIVPATIHGQPVTAVCSGELIEQVTHPNSPNKTIFYYMQTTPTTVQHISFAVGPFECHVIAEAPKPILGFCLPGDLDLLVESTSFLSKALTFYSTEYGSYPFTDYKAVFVSEPRSDCHTSATIAVLSSDLLHGPGAIDQAIQIRHILSLSLIQQWIGINVIQRSLADTWLINGLALYLSSTLLRLLLGSNEHRFRLKKDIQRCVREDRGKAPICVPGTLEPPDVQFINLKAPLVVHILNQHLAKSGPALGRVIPRIFLAALSDELTGNTLSTSYFFKTCRKVSGLDLQSFQDQWVFGSGCPTFRLATNFVRKKFIVELDVACTPTFTGSLTIRIHEADGAPFEHVVDIKQSQKKFNLPFNTKYKRTRRSARRLGPSDDEEINAAEPFAYPSWEDEEERQRWRVSDWSEEQAAEMLGEGGGYEWIRIDPDCEWIAAFDFAEKPWYWVSQLQGDKDVVAQLEAVQSMSIHLTPVIASELAKTILVSNYFYRVRMEAIRALTNFSTAECEYIGVFLLTKLHETLKQDPAAHFLRRSLATGLSDLRDPTNRTSWRSVRRLLLDEIEPDDHIDSIYLATIVSAAGNAFSASDIEEADEVMLRDATMAIERVITMDRLVPSHGNMVTIAGLKTLMKLVLSGRRTNDSRVFLSYTRSGNYEPLRRVAFDCLLLCRPPGRSAELTRYLCTVIRDDPSLSIRRHVAKLLSESILASLASGEVSGMPAPKLSEGIEGPDSQGIVRALRKEFGKKEDLREAIQAELYYPDHDDEVRLALIKVAELMTSSVAEPIPGQQVPEPLPPTPKIRISMSAPDAYPFPVVEAPVPKITLAKKKHKSQVKGLPDADRAAITNALKKLTAHRSSELFRQPVDPVRDQAPSYFEIIKNPMDLSTAQAKLAGGLYASRQDFADDMHLIVANCHTFNLPGSAVYRQGDAFEAYFQSLWTRTEATLNADVGAKPPAVQVQPTPAPPTTVPVLKVKVKPPASTVPPMAPPPVPASRLPEGSKKRKESSKPDKVLDDILGAEIDAIENVYTSVEPKAKKLKTVKAASPEKPAPVELSAPQPPAPPAWRAPRPPSGTPQTVGNSMQFRQKRGRHLINVLFKDPHAAVFTRPVDPIADGAPTYLDEIKEPMDLGTISKKIDQKKYKTMGDLAYDIELVIKNCRQFNYPGDGMYAFAEGLEAAYWKEWPRAAANKLLPNEKKELLGLLNKSLKEPISLLFREAGKCSWPVVIFSADSTLVDPVLLGIPTYFDIIPPEDARDLSLIKRKLEKGDTYRDAKQVDAEVEMMLENARAFNGPGEVSDAADRFGRWWKAQRSKLDV